MAPKNKTILDLNKFIQEIYDMHKDLDDGILYLSVVKNHFFGGQTDKSQT